MRILHQIEIIDATKRTIFILNLQINLPKFHKISKIYFKDISKSLSLLTLCQDFRHGLHGFHGFIIFSYP